jgi:hypothetical protein
MKCLVWIALTLAACGKSPSGTAGSNAPVPGSPPASAPAAAAETGPQDRCEIHVTGSETLDVIATKPRGSPNPQLSVGTEYWMTDDEIRYALAAMGSIGADKAQKAELERKVDEQMKKDPRLWLLIMNCGTDDTFLNFSSSNDSRSSDIPFGPHRYVVSSEPKAGEFSKMFSIKKGERVGYRSASPGKLEITKFDATGITAAFSFESETDDKSKHISVKGSFDFGCVGGKCK